MTKKNLKQQSIMNLKRTKIGIYIRVSTEKQEGNTSFDTQEETIQRYIAERPELQHYEQVMYEETHSASLMPRDSEVVRPKLRKLLMDVYSGEFAYVICYSHDRFTRNIEEFVIIQQTMKLLGVKVLYAKAGEDIKTENNSLNKLFENLMNNLAALEANVISSRVKMANKYKAKHGLWTGGQAPYGYRLIPSLENPKQNILCVNEVEANIIREIFDHYIKGYNNHDIAIFIKERYYNNNDRMWTHNTVKNILRNPVYKGLSAWNKKGGMRSQVRHSKDEYIYSPFNPQNVIVSLEVWERAARIRNILEENSKFIATKFVLKNFAYCGKCFKPLNGKNHGYNRRYYFCEEGHISVNAAMLDESVIFQMTAVMEKLLTLDDKLVEFYNAYVKKLEGLNLETTTYVEKIKKEIDLNKKVKACSLDKISEMEVNPNMMKKNYLELINSLKEQMIKWDILNEQLEIEISQKSLFEIPTLIEFKRLIESNNNDIIDILRNTDIDHRRRALRVLFNEILYKVIVHDIEDIEIIFK